MRQARFMILPTAFACTACMVQPATAGSHSWDINEVFSNEDGSIQFVELWESTGAPQEIFMSGKELISSATGKVFTFPETLSGITSNKHLLLATQSFADLPGAPTPDYILEPGFFATAGDTLTYDVWDDWTFGAVPTDCVESMNRIGGVTGNSPTNYSDESGKVDGCDTGEPSPDLDGDGVVGPADLAQLLGAWGPCRGACPADLNGDGAVGPADLALLLGAWG